jgi:GAF domain-containing protein
MARVSETGMNDMAARLLDVAAALEELKVLRGDEEELGQALRRLVDAGLHAIPSAEGLSVTVLVDGGRSAVTPAATDEVATALDREQYAAGEGPCLEAARTQRLVRADVTDVRDRWPGFAHAAESSGMHSYMSVPFLLDDKPVRGALNVYGGVAEAFRPLDEALLALLTATASSALVNSRRRRRAQELAENLKAAMASRAEIEQAKGVLMVQHGVTADRAFEMLVRRSQNDNIKLREIARSLLDSVSPSSAAEAAP